MDSFTIVIAFCENIVTVIFHYCDTHTAQHMHIIKLTQGIHTHWQTHTLTDRQTDRHTHWQTDTLTDRQTHWQTDNDRHTHWQTHTLTDRHTDRQADTHTLTDWQTDRHTHIDMLQTYTDRHTHTHTNRQTDIQTHWQTGRLTKPSTIRSRPVIPIAYCLNTSPPVSLMRGRGKSQTKHNYTVLQDIFCGILFSRIHKLF